MLNITKEQEVKVNKFLNAKCTILHGEETWRKFFQDVMFLFLRDGKKTDFSMMYGDSNWYDKLVIDINKYIDSDVIDSFDSNGDPYEVSIDLLTDIFDKISYILTKNS